MNLQFVILAELVQSPIPLLTLQPLILQPRIPQLRKLPLILRDHTLQLYNLLTVLIFKRDYLITEVEDLFVF